MDQFLPIASPCIVRTGHQTSLGAPNVVDANEPPERCLFINGRHDVNHVGLKRNADIRAGTNIVALRDMSRNRTVQWVSVRIADVDAKLGCLAKLKHFDYCPEYGILVFST